MRTFAFFLCGLVALAHIGFFVLEAYFWTRPLGRRVFRRSEAFMKESASLALNQGLYNGFLAAGLIWGLWLHAQGAAHAPAVLMFFLICVGIAGVVGALSVSPRIVLVQAAPAVVALAMLWAST